jgi:DNA-binding PadR family transcriptional regulator
MGNPFAAETELLILCLLKSEPAGMYGLELVRTSNRKLKRGTVYVTLGRLEEKGYVKSRVKPDADHPGIPRPIYKITAAGERVLAGAELAGWNLARAPCT